ncbi:MAG: hypothetical protein XD90_0899, partial [Methanobacterium sp. 42_16]
FSDDNHWAFDSVKRVVIKMMIGGSALVK